MNMSLPKSMMIVLALLVVIFIAGAGLSVWNFLQFAPLTEESDRIENEVNANKVRLAELQNTISDMLTLQAESEALKRRVPNESDTMMMYQSVQTLVSQSGATLASLNFRESEAEGESGMLRYPFEARVVGEYPAFVRILQGMENLERFVRVESVEVSASEGLGGETTMNVTAMIFTQPPTGI
jgi:Tfp pilus assembly protein PilO